MKALFDFLRWPVLCGILAAIIILEYFPTLIGQPRNQDSSANITPPATAQGPYSYSKAVRLAAPAVVNIYTRKVVKQKLPPQYNDPMFRRFLERNNIRLRDRVQRSLGSGVIIDTQGFILTNNHVISGADEIVILTFDGREAQAKLVGADPESDLAVLKTDLDNLNAINIGEPAEAMVGDVVLAIGNPYGFGQTVTQGIISATGRYGLRLSTYENYIQTDAAINPGNSGGALIDADGKMLGINTAIWSGRSGASQGIGIGLATPSDLALRIMKDLIEHGKVIRGWLGVEVSPLPAKLAEANNLSQNNGVVIARTDENGPAANSGLKSGDILTLINGLAVGDGHAGMNFIASTRPGDKVQVEFIREGERRTVEIEVGSRPEPIKN